MAFADFENALNDTNEVELTTTGRTSGRESSRPVWFVREGENEQFRANYGARDVEAYYPKRDVAVEVPPA